MVLLAFSSLWWSAGIAGWLSATAAAALGGTVLLLVHRLSSNRRPAYGPWPTSRSTSKTATSAAHLRAVHADTGAATSGLPPDESASRFDRAAHGVERALGERERRWQARMRLSADWHWETDAALRFSWVSRDLASLVKLGVQPADLVGHRRRRGVVVPAAGRGLVGADRAHAATPAAAGLDARSARPATAAVGGPQWPRLPRQAGRLCWLRRVGRDITEQRLAYLRLAESERRHAMMAELSVDWYWQTDAEHRIEQFGPVAQELLGTRAVEAIGQTRWALHPDGASEGEWPHTAPISMRGAVPRLRVRNPSGRPRRALDCHRRPTARGRPRRIHRLPRRRP